VVAPLRRARRRRAARPFQPAPSVPDAPARAHRGQGVADMAMGIAGGASATVSGMSSARSDTRAQHGRRGRRRWVACSAAHRRQHSTRVRPRRRSLRRFTPMGR
jgi:hypothetical protein